MTFSAAPLSVEVPKALRARLAFVAREPEPRRFGAARSPAVWLGAVAAAGLCIASAMLLERGIARRAVPVAAAAPVVPVAVAPPAPAWAEIVRPFMAYDLAGGPYARLPLAYAARRDLGGTARQDTLTYGAPVPGQAFLRMTLYRRGVEPAPESTVFVDAARLAAGAGLAITRAGLASSLPTRFGTVEVAGVAVAEPDRSAPCLAFRLADPASAAVLRLTGLACGTDEKPITPASLACTVEKIDLVSAGDDEDLRAVFVAAERRRGVGCHEERGALLRPGLPDERPAHGTLKGPL